MIRYRISSEMTGLSEKETMGVVVILRERGYEVGYEVVYFNDGYRGLGRLRISQSGHLYAPGGIESFDADFDDLCRSRGRGGSNREREEEDGGVGFY